MGHSHSFSLHPVASVSPSSHYRCGRGARGRKGLRNNTDRQGLQQKDRIVKQHPASAPLGSELRSPQNGSSVPLPPSKETLCWEVKMQFVLRCFFLGYRMLGWIELHAKENAKGGRRAGVSTERSGSWGSFARGQGLGPRWGNNLGSRSVSQGMHG